MFTLMTLHFTNIRTVVQYLGIYQRKTDPVITPEQPTLGPKLIKLLEQSKATALMDTRQKEKEQRN